MNTFAPPLQTRHSFAPMPEKFVGKINTIGEFGPIYEVERPICQTESGDWLMRITLIESGEATDYLLSSIQEDPEAV